MIRNPGTWLQFALLVALAACATPFKERFGRIQLGMDKSDVIDELGSPTRTLRHEEQDIWIYNVHEDDGIEVREISFKTGIVNYTGEERSRSTVVKPPSSPEEAQDRLKQSLTPNSPAQHQFKDVKEDGTY